MTLLLIWVEQEVLRLLCDDSAMTPEPTNYEPISILAPTWVSQEISKSLVSGL